MTDIASLRLDIDSTSAVDAKKDQDELTKSGEKLERKYEDIAKASNKVSSETVKAAENFQRQQQTVQNTTQQYGKLNDEIESLTGGTGGLITRAGLLTAGLGALAAAGLALGAALYRSNIEVRELNTAFQVTSGYAGQTQRSIYNLSHEIANLTTMTVGASRALVTELVASGQIGVGALGSIATMASDFAVATGRDVSRIGSEMVKLFADPAKGAEELNKQMHFLAPAEISHIKHLRDIGELGRAQVELAAKLAAHLPKEREELGMLEVAWLKVRQAASGAWDAMLNIGRPNALQKELEDSRKAVEELAGIAGLRPNDSRNNARLEAAMRRVTELEAQLAAQRKATQDKAEAAEENRVQNMATNLVKQTSEYAKISDIQDKIVLANKMAANTDEERRDKARAIFDLNRQIFEIQRNIGAESREITEARISGEQKVAEIQKKGIDGFLEAQLKLGTITKPERDAALLANELNLNFVKQLGIQEQLRYGLLLPAERERLRIALELLKIEAGQLGEKGKLDRMVEQNKIVQAQLDADAKGSASMVENRMRVMETLDKQIEQQRIHNSEIGKTKEQVELLKAAEIDRAIARLEADFAGNEGDERYIAALETQIAKLRELQGLQRDAAALEKQTEAVKKQGQEFDRLWRDVEQTGKTVFTNLFSKGKDAFEGIGKALKASVIDVLYQLTARPFIINIGANIASAMGLNTANSSLLGGADSGGAFGGIGNMFSSANTIGQTLTGNNWLGSALGFGGSAALASSGFGLTAAGMTGGGIGLSGAGMGSLLGAGGSSAGFGLTAGAMTGAELGIAGSAAASGMGAAGGVMAGIGAAIPYVGIAIAVLSMLGAFDGGGGPKTPELGLFGGSGGERFFIGQNNMPGGEANLPLYNQVNTMLNDPTKFDPKVLAQFSGQWHTLGEDPQSAVQKLLQMLQPAAQAAQFSNSIKDLKTQLEIAKDPVKHWENEVAKMAKDVKSHATTIEEWRAEFLKVLDGPVTQDQFTKWQNFGIALMNLSNVVGKTADDLTLVTDRFKTLVDYTRAVRYASNPATAKMIPGFAGGVDSFAGGLAMVGETGPELVSLGAGSSVINNGTTRSLFDITGLVNEIRSLRSELRAGNEAIARNTSSTSRILDRASKDGLYVRGPQPDAAVEVNVTESVPVPVS